MLTTRKVFDDEPHSPLDALQHLRETFSRHTMLLNARPLESSNQSISGNRLSSFPLGNGRWNADRRIVGGSGSRPTVQ